MGSLPQHTQSMVNYLKAFCCVYAATFPTDVPQYYRFNLPQTLYQTKQVFAFWSREIIIYGQLKSFIFYMNESWTYVTYVTNHW